jgi:hypothetical protein
MEDRFCDGSGEDKGAKGVKGVELLRDWED